MSEKLELYWRHRKGMLPGDVIAFSGRGPVSKVIRWATRSRISHVGTVLLTCVSHDGTTVEPGRQVEMIDSTTLGPRCGVAVSKLSTVLLGYRGTAFWYPLLPEVRQSFDPIEFARFAIRQDGAGYDIRQAILSGLDPPRWLRLLSWLTTARENLDRLYCSELAAAALRAGGALPDDLDVSEVTPADLVESGVFGEPWQILV